MSTLLRVQRVVEANADEFGRPRDQWRGFHGIENEPGRGRRICGCSLGVGQNCGTGRDQALQVFGERGIADAEIDHGLPVNQAEGSAFALLEHHELHRLLPFHSGTLCPVASMAAVMAEGYLFCATKSSARICAIERSRCFSHQPYWIGQSSMASTALRPSAISAI